ncbi:MAG: hypothetical protein ACRES4_08295, partial [Nevskiales bacterium]
MHALARIAVFSVAAAGLWAVANADQNPAMPAGVIQRDARQLQWSEAPATMPAGTRITVLEGDPKTEGLFTLRLRIPAGARL